MESGVYDYLKDENHHKVCCLLGLKETGKTVMMLQAIQSLHFENCLLLECEEESQESMANLKKVLSEHPEYKYIFIDEITKIHNFINTASFLANRFASEGIKIVITGDDSLSIAFVTENELYNQNVTISTTYISFQEYHYLLGKGLTDYIRYGGTLAIEKDWNIYADLAIVQNIVNSLERYKNGNNSSIWMLQSLIDEGMLETLILKVAEYPTREFVEKIVNRYFKAHHEEMQKQIRSLYFAISEI